MIDEHFEWDDEKATANLAKHGVSFNQAVLGFSDAFAVDRIDDRWNYGEERMNILAMCRGIIIQVTYSERSGRVRIVSARKAEKHEQNDYYRKNSV